MHPHNALALKDWYTTARQIGNYAEMVDTLCVVLESNGDNDLAYYYLGLCMARLGQYTAALECIDKAIFLNPASSQYFFDRGNVLIELGEPLKAREAFDLALSLDSNYADAYSSRGIVLAGLGEVDAAIQDFNRSISLKPESAATYLNRGNAYQDKGQFIEAIESYDHAIRLQPHYPMAFLNRGVALKQLHRLEESLANTQEALAQDPNYVDAHWNTSLTLLLAGDLGRGFQGYDKRWQTEAFKPFRRHFSEPIWLGNESLSGKRLFVHNEQGFGDSLQFCRFVTLAALAGAQVIYEVEDPLYDLMQSLAGVHTLIRQRDSIPPFDFYCPVMSLPAAFKTTLETVPAMVPYLFGSADRGRHWDRVLGERVRPRIGIVWSGSPHHKADHQRSIALGELMQSLPVDYEYVSLQKEIRAQDSTALAEHPHLRHFGNQIDNFWDTAALCEQMDLVIAVDTSVAHLAGALGVDTYLLLPYLPDWRWLLGRDDSPWYPTMQLFRQETAGDWAPVLKRVSDQISKLPV